MPKACSRLRSISGPTGVTIWCALCVYARYTAMTFLICADGPSWTCPRHRSCRPFAIAVTRPRRGYPLILFGHINFTTVTAERETRVSTTDVGGRTGIYYYHHYTCSSASRDVRCACTLYRLYYCIVYDKLIRNTLECILKMDRPTRW
jgi:hypothetical protein